ncbi:MAG: hypothetical protein MJZ37_00630 [Bacilli bacterium]|nr:hypothetical protein [Bacilli bacterium]
MATFNYPEMREVANNLFDLFGNPFSLKKEVGEPAYNPKTKKVEPVFAEYKGRCVMKTYTAEAIGELSNIIQAGDVSFSCTMDDISIIPKESKDKVLYEGITYNIISVATSNPSGKYILVHTLHCRRAS